MQKPHICFISESEATYGILTGNPSTRTGGAEVQQTVLAAALQAMGYSATFIVPDFGQPVKVVTDCGITLIKMRARKALPFGLRYFDEIARTFQAMGRAGADVYYQRIGGHVTGIASMYCNLHRKPMVFSVAHNEDLDGSASLRMSKHYHALYQYGLHHATAIVVQTDDQMDLLDKNVGREGVLIRSTYALPKDAEVNGPKQYVLWVGSFSHLKRPEMFADLAERLPQYEFVMVGGPGHGKGVSLMDEVRARAESIPNLRLTGLIPYSEVGSYFGEAKLLVNTSTDEGFPNTYVQAWCRGVPVVGTFDADGLIRRYGLGRHCSTLDELAAAVVEFMDDNELRTSVSGDALRYVQENHSPDAIAEKYDNLLMRLYRGGKPSDNR